MAGFYLSIVRIALMSAALTISVAGVRAQAAGRRPIVVKAEPKKEAPKLAMTPAEFIQGRTQRILNELKSRPVRAAGAAFQNVNVGTAANRAAWLSSVYARNMVETSWATKMLADRRLFAAVIERELGPKSDLFYPKTLGLREFLVKHAFVQPDGTIKPDGEAIESALYEEFPAGFVVRPAVGVTPQEKAHGLFNDSDAFVMELLRPETVLYQSSHYRHPVKSHILDAIASGEAIVLQESVVGAADVHQPLKTKFAREVRIHTYENQVVVGAVPSRWVQTDLSSEADVAKAEGFTEAFLKLLSPSLLTRQAWGIDVAVMDNGDMRISDLITNRGEKIAWSGYLDQPRVIGAYARHFEAVYGWRFEGISGSLIRHNLANYFPYWEKRIEKARPGWNKVMAYLPPVP